MKSRKLYFSAVFFCLVVMFGLVGCGGGGGDGESSGVNIGGTKIDSKDYQGNWNGKASKIGDKQASFGTILFDPLVTLITNTEIKFQISGNNIKGTWTMWSGAIGICNPLDPNYWSNPACTNPFKPVLWSTFEGACTFSDKMYCKVNSKEWKDSTDITGIVNSDSTMSVKFITPGQTEPFMTADSIKRST